MKLTPIHIEGELFKVAIADTEETQTKGLSGVKTLGNQKGMLFIFPDPIRVFMTMKDMNFDLDFIFLDENWKVIQTGSLSKEGGENSIITANYPSSMILEVPRGTVSRLKVYVGKHLKPSKKLNTHFEGVKKFKHGGKFEMIGEKVYEVKVDDIKIEPDKLQILNDKGEVVANISPGARIFSREHTKELIKNYKKGDKNALAEAIVKILDIQDNQKPDYVKKED